MRYTVGRLTGRVGTIVGPKDITGEYLCIFDQDGSVGYATIPELKAATERINRGDVWSVTEHEMKMVLQQYELDMLRGSVYRKVK